MGASPSLCVARSWCGGCLGRSPACSWACGIGLGEAARFGREQFRGLQEICETAEGEWRRVFGLVGIVVAVIGLDAVEAIVGVVVLLAWGGGLVVFSVLLQLCSPSGGVERMHGPTPVSYTHLTLPTIYSV